MTTLFAPAPATILDLTFNDECPFVVSRISDTELDLTRGRGSMVISGVRYDFPFYDVTMPSPVEEFFRYEFFAALAVRDVCGAANVLDTYRHIGIDYPKWLAVIRSLKLEL